VRFSRRMESNLMNYTFGTRTKRNPYTGFTGFFILIPGLEREARPNPGLGLANAFGVKPELRVWWPRGPAFGGYAGVKSLCGPSPPLPSR